jgi:hypothetical protein
MNKDVPKGTFRFEVEVGNGSLTAEDLACLHWAFTQQTFPDTGDSDWFHETRFYQPYEQGGGATTVRWIGTGDPYIAYMRETIWAALGVPHPPKAEFTGWIFTDWYTDSMTGVYESPIWRLPNGEFWMVEP